MQDAMLIEHARPCIAQRICRAAENKDGAVIRDSAWKGDLARGGCRDRMGLIGTRDFAQACSANKGAAIRAWDVVAAA